MNNTNLKEENFNRVNNLLKHIKHSIENQEDSLNKDGIVYINDIAMIKKDIRRLYQDAIDTGVGVKLS
jgi:hypothetical protein